MTGESLSVIVPCFNEGPRIVASLMTLRQWLGPDAEIVVVDDGSRDDTAARVTSHALDDPHVRLERLPHNAGKGAAIRRATSKVRGDRVILVDADLAYDRPSIERAIQALDGHDFVSGDRRHALSTYDVPVRLFGFLYRRHIVGLAFNFYARLLTGVTARDTQCGLKAFRRDALVSMVPSLGTDGFAQDVEMHLVARGLRLRHTTVPVRVTYESAASSVRLARSAAAMAAAVLRLALRRAAGCYAPRRVVALATASRHPASAPRERARDQSPGAGA